MSTSTLEYALAEASQWLHRLKVLHGIDLTTQAHRKTVHEAVELADDQKQPHVTWLWEIKARQS